MRHGTHQHRFDWRRCRWGALALLIAGCLTMAGCGKDSGPPPPSAVDKAESFTFFDLGRSSVLDDAVRDRLSKELGAVAVERRGILDLAPDGRRLLADHLPAIYQLDRRLNKDYRERVEHELLKLMYRYPAHTSPAFETVRLVFDLATGHPLHFQATANQAGAEILAVLNSKYGPPEEIADATGPILQWEKLGDRLIVLPRRSRLGQPEYHIRIYFMGNIDAMLAREADSAAKERAKNARSAF